jgi:DNA polymerase
LPSKFPADPLEKISLKVKACTLCKLSRTRKNAVAGEGSHSARVMFVGEAPGRHEDSEGKPFIGYAGKILDKALHKAGLKRSEIFITNVVKCRPPNNRRPASNELSACMGHLDRQISLLSPKIICILGSTAYHTLLGGKSILADHGKVVEKEGKRFFLTVHPASVIYDRSLRSVLEKDLSALAEETRKSKQIKKTRKSKTISTSNNKDSKLLNRK